MSAPRETLQCSTQCLRHQIAHLATKFILPKMQPIPKTQQTPPLANFWLKQIMTIQILLKQILQLLHLKWSGK